MKIKELLQLIDAEHLKHKTSKPYVCGGLPRDRYMGRISSIVDIDITTGDQDSEKLSLEVFNTLNKQFNIKRDIKSDGHSSIYFNNMKIDFSSNYIAPGLERYLPSIGINYPTPMQKEAFSRDFGCNSLLLTLDFKSLLDPTKRGIDDCDNKKIRPLLPLDVTFAVNKKTGFNNRIVRAIYLSCKLGFDIDESIINYVSLNPKLIESTEPRSLAYKLNKSYDIDPNKTIYYIDKMNLKKFIPITNMLSDGVLNFLANRVTNA